MVKCAPKRSAKKNRALKYRTNVYQPLPTIKIPDTLAAGSYSVPGSFKRERKSVSESI